MNEWINEWMNEWIIKWLIKEKKVSRDSPAQSPDLLAALNSAQTLFCTRKTDTRTEKQTDQLAYFH